MKVFAREIEEIAKTLPVGYYAFSRVPVTVCTDVKEDRGSFFNPVENTITISAKSIIEAVEKVPEDESLKETLTRSLVYHEVSHAILTPRFERVTPQLNIMEDERIETVLKDYYLDVNFRKTAELCNDWSGSPSQPYTHPLQMFYDIVRFQYGDTALVAEAKKIIKNYDYLNSASDHWEMESYNYKIEDLYKKVCKLFNEEQKQQPQSSSQSNGQQGNSENGNGQQNTTYSQDMGDSAQQEQGQEQGQENGQTSNGNDGEQKQGCRMTAQDLKSSPLSEAERQRIKAQVDSLINGVFNQYENWHIKVEEDSRLTDNVDRIITDFKKKNSGGSAVASYSGYLNPRNCARTDYRFFDKKANINGANKFGTAHLNLFIDVSGSMSRSQEKLNQLLSTIYHVAKGNKNFTYTVIACSIGQKVQDNKTTPYVNCDGGNKITDDIWEQYRQAQLPNTMNYNIAMFDGDAFSGGGSERNFGVFNHSNCTVITDNENSRYLKYIPSARAIVTKNYVRELHDEVIKALSLAFR